MSWSSRTSVVPTFWPIGGSKMPPAEQLKDAKKVFPVFQKLVSPVALATPRTELSMKQHLSLQSPRVYLMYSFSEAQQVLPMLLGKK